MGNGIFMQFEVQTAVTDPAVCPNTGTSPDNFLQIKIRKLTTV